MSTSISNWRLLWGVYEEDCVSSLHLRLRFATQWASSWRFFFFNLWTRRKVQCVEPNLHRRWHGKGCFVSFYFPYVLEIAQPDYTRRDTSVIGIIRTLSRIVRIFFSRLVAEARDFSLLFPRLRESVEPDHSEWSCDGTSCHSKAN